MTYFTHYHSPLGVLTIASDGTHITGLWMEGQKYFDSAMVSNAVEDANIPVLRSTIQWLSGYFCGTVQSLDHIPLLPAGTPFQQRVWEILCQIPYSKTITYGEVSRRVADTFGKDRISAQAASNAVSRNPISILIPCHRVVGANGNLTGYAGGLERKSFLLQLEQRNTKDNSQCI